MSGTETDPVVIDEVVTLEPDGEEVKFARAEFATVIFHNIAETYPEDAHIECRYTVTSELIPTSRDYVALYKVGWMSPRDYIYYEWAPIPKDYKVGYEADSSVLFPSHKLPKDDGEFYQFCYVSSSNQIRGASTPFQFRRPGADDFVEVEDEDTNMLVIRSKTLYLEENLQMAQSQKQKLIEAQEALQKERDSIITKYQEVKNRLVTIEAEHVTLKGHLTKSEGTVEQLKREARDMITVRDELQNKIDKLKGEQATLNEKIRSLTSDLTASMATVARMTAELEARKKQVNELQSERDELSGKNAILEEKTEVLKKHAETTETTADQYNKQFESLQIRCAQQESLIENLRGNIDTITAELEDNRQNLDKQTAVNMQDKELVESLEEKLKNAEDKLLAAEESKAMLQKEITTYEVTQASMSRQIEVSKSECDSLKKKLVTLEEDFTQKTQIQAAEMEQTLNDVLGAVQEKEKLQKENSQLKHSLSQTMEKSDMSHGSMSIMKQSLGQIKQRLDKKEKQCKRLEKLVRSREQEFLERERETRREIEDLKEKIYMCGEEYKTLYIEKSKLQKKVDKWTNKRKHERKSVSEEKIEVADVQKSAAVSEGESEVTLDTNLEEEVEKLEMALDNKILKKEKYKTQLAEEREKNGDLRREHAEEIKEKDAEIARLKKRIQDLPSDKDLKLRTLEKCVHEKDVIIDELNQKLRLYNLGRNDETGASMLPRGPSGSVFYGHEATHTAGLSCTHWVPMYPQAPLQYPQPTQPYTVQPLVYPHPQPGPQQQVPPIPPRTRPPVMKEGKQEPSGPVDDVSVLDTTEKVSTSLEVPMKPLPAPLEPEVLPTAKVAAVKAAIDEPDALLPESFCAETDLKVRIPDGPMVPGYDFGGPEIREDRFYDAEGSSMKLCPECNKTFPADVEEQVLLEHQVSHMGAMCPICMMLKPDNMTDDDFSRHVNKHCQDEEDNDNVV